MFLLGQRLGNYEVERNLGRGTFGAVYLVRDVFLQQRRAIKVPHDQSPEGREALLRESRLLAALDHPNIVRLIACDEQQGALFVVMEWVDGEPLSRRIEHDAPLAAEAALRIAVGVLSGLEYAHRHRRLLHGDLSADNILLSSGDSTKITDFGIARTVQVADHDARYLGNPYYLAPEQFRGEAVFASDVYSVGVVLYQMLTGKLPYCDPDPKQQRQLVEAGKNRRPRKRNPLVSNDLDAVVEKALAPDVSERYGSADGLLSDLREMVSFGPSPEELAAVRSRIRQGQPRRRKGCWRCGRPRHPDARCCAHCGV